MFQKITTLPLIFLIRIYQKTLSPDQSFWGKSMGFRVCIFHPTCSEYSVQALKKYGLAKGSWLTVKRISRCHPWNEGGVDKVP